MYKINLEQNAFEVRMTPSTPFILEETKNKLYLLFEIQVEEKSRKEERKNPFNLALVLDRSGSMHGQKIEFAKQAVKEVIANLRPDDELHLVIYDNVVNVVFEKGDLKRKEQLQQKVNSITDRNATFLSGGLQKGAELVQKHLSGEKSNRVFIFSDGLANVGLKSPSELTDLAKQINREGINISSFGIGDDFDEYIIQNLAEHGRGDYFFIDEADKIPNIVDEAIQGLLGLVLSNVELQFSSGIGVDIKKVYSYKEGVILGDVRETETRQVLVEIEVDPKVADPKKIIYFELKYRTIDDIMNEKTFTETLGIPFTINEEDILTENGDVLLVKHLLETAEKELEIAKLIENFDYEQAEDYQEKLIQFLKNLTLKDKEGALAEKIAYLEKILKRTQDGDYMRSLKMQKYSSYYSGYSKKRMMLDIMENNKRQAQEQKKKEEERKKLIEEKKEEEGEKKKKKKFGLF
ncbi:MAG: vWA domain-containing protein [Candidatus Hodarchaeales archaeon]|jgi:Ca-activated chloride channel family protein